jgi:hypothetical protein
VNPLAKTTTPTQSQPKPSAALLPKGTDPRSELFFLLGHLKGSGFESASRITELVIDLTAAAEPAETGGE